MVLRDSRLLVSSLCAANMEPRHREILRKHRVELSNQLLVSDTVLPFLYQESVLTESQVEEIESQISNKKKTLRLLDILPSRGPLAFDAFLRSLEEFSWLRDKILQELQAQRAAGLASKDDWHIPEAVLQKVPSDRELSRLASRLGPEWESVLLDLGLSAEALFRCRADHSLSTHGQVLAGLIQWRRSLGKEATVQQLLQSLQAADIHPSILEEVFH
ncbi:death domain-containing protein CRADD [Myripristis murdjan]|uniref:CASP2 and RIPK1 domain containing adaptor with death domain n=1 Tax=Myripristis murdjan TaxID=586833 RepID=A0A667YVV2_9TELE|nr:death domain-containing protein CRADD-like [Myripristis murdjan]